MKLTKAIFYLVLMFISSLSSAQPNQNADRTNEIAAKNNYQRSINQFCRGKPTVDAQLKEAMSNRLRVSPDSISLNRVEIYTKELIYVEMNGFSNRTDGSNRYSYCHGVFYSPGGSFECNLNFNQNNVIVNACDVRSGTFFTDSLFNTWAQLYAANSTSQTPQPKSCGVNKYCYDSSGRPAGERDAVTCKCPNQ